MTPLRTALAQMVQAAEAHPGHPQRTRLEHGLHLDVLTKPEGTTHLQLWRATAYPSEQEFATVLAHWPYPVDAQPRRFIFRKGFYLAAVWPTPRRLVNP